MNNPTHVDSKTTSTGDVYESTVYINTTHSFNAMLDLPNPV